MPIDDGRLPTPGIELTTSGWYLFIIVKIKMHKVLVNYWDSLGKVLGQSGECLGKSY